MSDTPWTPGPWRLDVLQGYDSYDELVETDVEITAANGKHIHSHDLGYCDDTDAEIKATARLIAAAPDMAEALEQLIYAITSLSAEEDDGAHWCRINKFDLGKARDALARARGAA